MASVGGTLPAQLPREVQQKLASRPLERVVCDYIAGMTDRYCLKLLGVGAS